jgi:hypothetical protein
VEGGGREATSSAAST